VIEVRNLRKEYGGAEAVRDVSFTIRPGEPTGYLGPNGAGKSTTVKIIAGLVRATSGTVSVCGQDVERTPLEAKRRIGYVPDNSALYTSLTPHEYLSLAAELHQLDRASAAERIGQFLHAFAITELADRQIETLSKGQRQKVLLTGALLHDPDVLLLDEPLNGLDVNAVLTFRRLLEHLAGRGKTILFCSHILEVIERLCRRVIVIDRGRIVADDTTERLMARTSEGTLSAVFQSLTRPEAEDSLRGVLEALGDGSGKHGLPSHSPVPFGD
jgi:ABC-2 type transport system ATP-binding protein